MTNKRRIASVVLTILFLSLLVLHVDVDRFVIVLSRVDRVWYSLAVLGFVVSYIPLTLRWRLLLRSVGYPSDVRPCFEVIAISHSLNKALPVNTGDFGRSVLVNQYYDIQTHSEILGIVAFERLMDLVTIGILVFLVAFFSPLSPSFDTGLLWAGLVLVLSLLLVGRCDRARITLLSWLPDVFRNTASNALSGYIRLSAGEVGVVFVYSFLRWGIGMGLLLPLAIAIDVRVTFAVAVLTVGSMGLMSTVPLSPGGIGPVEATGVGVLVYTGMKPAEALTLVFLQRSLGLGLTILIGTAVYNYSVHRP